MSFESVVYSTLANDATLTGLCPRIYPQQPVDSANFPFAWYSFKRSDTLNFTGINVGISTYTFEITVLSKTVAEVKAITNRIIVLLDNLTSMPDVGMMVLEDTAMATRSDGYVYYAKSLKFKGIGL